MIQIKIDGETLDLPEGFAIEIEDTNPVFNDMGSQSVPATVPATRRNTAILQAPHRIDAGSDASSPDMTADLIAGGFQRRGILNITEAGKVEGITFNIGFDNSTAYAKWAQKKLAELTNLPVYTPAVLQGQTQIKSLLEELYRVFREPDSRRDDFAVFPLAVNNESTGSDKETITYWEVLNVAGANGLEQPTKVNRLIEGEVTEVSVPEAYGVSPFLRVWRVLELIFEDLGLDVLENPFKENLELSRLVVLNNAADACCTGSINYAELMPDCTVEEFLNALYVRFGLVYCIDANTGNVTLRLIRDIIEQRDSIALDAFAADYEKITYNSPQYIKLSANTSIENAKTSNDRFEDFAKGVNLQSVRLGAHVSQWQMTGTPENPKWDGDVRDDWGEIDPDPDYPEPPDPDYPDPDDDRDNTTGDDDRDFPDNYSSRSITKTESSEATTPKSSFIAREFITGQWYRLDALNGKVCLSSSSFFNWDPQPEGLSELDLNSDDECIPVMRVSTQETGTGHAFNDICPLYLFGARHYHSYVKGSDASDGNGDSTPLAFIFAYTKEGKTFGRNNGEGENGSPISLDDGSRPTTSLFFQFSDGLFARFWTAYDEILRHGNRTVEVRLRLNKLFLARLDMLAIYTFKGIRCLIDTVTYSLPAGNEVDVTMKLRTLQTQGTYDIDAEQNIPKFAASARHLEWRLASDSFGQQLDTSEARVEAARNYIAYAEYKPHGVEGDYWYIGANSAVLARLERLEPVWQTDPALPLPMAAGEKNLRKYKARLWYDIFEIHDMGMQDGPQDWELDDVALGQEYVDVVYSIELQARWVAD